MCAAFPRRTSLKNRAQDHDGSHIKGLILNYLDHFYPSLLKIPKFLVEFVTPIVRVCISEIHLQRSPLILAPKVTKGKEKINFFTIPEYERWLETTPDVHKWKAKYYKVSPLVANFTSTLQHILSLGFGNQ